MKKQLLFIQGGGNGGCETDAKLVNELQEKLGKNFEIDYPRMNTDEAKPDFGWLRQIGDMIQKLEDDLVIVAHSLGASLLLKYLSENKSTRKISGVFLLATPFWSGDEQWKQGLKLRDDFDKHLLANGSIFFYHCRDDEEVPFDHFVTYQHKLPNATFREIESGGHMFTGSIDFIAKDIESV